MFERIHKRLSRSVSKAGEYLSFPGIGSPTPTKQFKRAIVDEQEEKAIEIYNAAAENGHSLVQDLHPSKPFPSKKHHNDETTPLHLSAKYALLKLFVELLSNNGDPSFANQNKETCLHSVCSSASKPEIRFQLMELILQWRGSFDLGHFDEQVSLNRVDLNGDTAIHLAASNGLMQCVEYLVAHGAIISIVNKANRTCCELAAENNFIFLADMLELALVFQPSDKMMIEYNKHQFSQYDQQHPAVKLFLDSTSLTNSEIDVFITEKIELTFALLTSKSPLNASTSKAEALLTAYAWDYEVLRARLEENIYETFSAAKLQVTEITSSKETLHATSHRHTKDQCLDTTSHVKCSENEPNEFELLEEGEDSNYELQVALDDIVIDMDQAWPKLSPSNDIDGKNINICSICGEDMASAVDLSDSSHIKSIKCNDDISTYHEFCIDCWSSFARVQVIENGSGHLQCPGYKCGEILDSNKWACILLKDKETVDKFELQRKRQVIYCCESLKQCPIENCGLIVKIIDQSASTSLIPVELSKSIICDNGHSFCVSCSQEAHSPCNCERLTAWHNLLQNEFKSLNLSNNKSSADPSATESADLANALWVAANTKRCPRCSTPIEKDEGCNHMNCRKCRKEFCWICMQDWSLHSDASGGYFQCNRFTQNLNVDSNSPGRVVEAAGAWTDDRGNAHAESLRLKEKNKKMARFIHHYTRYQAHSDSVILEAKIFKDTIVRISDGLKNSQPGGKLKWLQGFLEPHPLLSSSQVDQRCDIQNCEIKIAISFLFDGFMELFKSRNVLKWSYPYVYFEFEATDETDYTANFNYRHGNRAKIENFRSSFVILQSELEGFIETLSDVVARRRLRAGKDQIILATKTAKFKRIELESLIIKFKISMKNPEKDNKKITKPIQRANSRINESVGYHRTFNNRRSAGINRSNEIARNSDSEESVDLAEILYEIGLLSSSLTTSTSDENKLMKINNILKDETSREDIKLNIPAPTYSENNLENKKYKPISQYLKSRRKSSSRDRLHGNNTNNSSPFKQQQILTVRPPKNDSPGNNMKYSIDSDFEIEQSSSDEDACSSNTDMNIKNEGSDSNEIIDPNQYSTDTVVRMLRYGTNNFQNEISSQPDENNANSSKATFNDENDLKISTLSQRAKEEAALNRAILMSLQESNAFMNRSNSGDVSLPEAPAESDVEMLIAMGFERDHVLQTLRETKFNLELAANRLLGIDF